MYVGGGSILAPPPLCPSLGFGALPPFTGSAPLKSDMTFLFQASPQPLISAATYAAVTPAFTGTREGDAVAPRCVSNQAAECTAMSVCESTQMFTCVSGTAALVR